MHRPPSAEPHPLVPILATAVWPLTLKYKWWTFSKEYLTVSDATGRALLYVREKVFVEVEHLEIFSDSGFTQKLANLTETGRTLLRHTTAEGTDLGATQRERSPFRVRYETFDPGDQRPTHTIREANPAIKFLDKLVGQIPLAGPLITTWILQTKYLAKDAQGKLTLTLERKPCLLGNSYKLSQASELPTLHQARLLMSFILLSLKQKGWS